LKRIPLDDLSKQLSRRVRDLLRIVFRDRSGSANRIGASPQTGRLGDDGDESRMVVALILDAFLQHCKPVASGRRATRDRRARKISTLRDFARGTTRVERLGWLDPPVGLKKAAALRERDGMARGDTQSIECRAFGSEQAVTHWNERLTDCPQIRIGGESLPAGVHSPDC